MPRKKNYQIKRDRLNVYQAGTESPAQVVDASMPSRARIDMRALLGEHARFTKEVQYIDLSEWLQRGIDPWVDGTISCLRSLLLSGSRETATVDTYGKRIRRFFEYLVQGRTAPLVASPSQLSPLHLFQFEAWLLKRATAAGDKMTSARQDYHAAKAIIFEMIAMGLVPGERSRFEKKGIFANAPNTASSHTSLSDAEQERLAGAIKSDLVALHHKRLELNQSAIQALRLLLVAHRQGLNPSPLIQLDRSAVAPGVMPGTVLLQTRKFRGKTRKARPGRSGPPPAREDEYIAFSLAEGAILLLAINETKELLADAPAEYKNRIWLYRSLRSAHSTKVGAVTCIKDSSLRLAVKSLVARHGLLGDDGLPLKVNLSRLRKSYFDRAQRVSGGDIVTTANLMGNTPRVAGTNYPSMNDSRVIEAAQFLGSDYVESMRSAPDSLVIPIKAVAQGPVTSTAVAGCSDSLNGHHAPRDGLNHCDRYVMCLFCPSFAIVGTVDELWRLFSFQAFAKVELKYLDQALGPDGNGAEVLEDLRDRYRVAVPYIDHFTCQKFPASVVDQARVKAEATLHPYWAYQMQHSTRVRLRQGQAQSTSAPPHQENIDNIDHHGS